MKRTHKIIWALTLLLGIAGVGGMYWRWWIMPLSVGRQAVDFEIMPGESLRQVSAKLETMGVLSHAWELVVFARLHGAAGGMRAGEYLLAPDTTLNGLLALIRSGKVVMHSLTLVDGWTFAEVLSAVEQEPNLRHTLTGTDGREIMQRLGGQALSPEGMFYPDTYSFPRGLTDIAFLKRAYDALQARLQSSWQGRAAGLPYKSPYDALIMASLVEKETAQPTERPLIAGVFLRRLQKGMMLQTDPTIIYGLGDRYTGRITYRDLRTDTPYNTYTRFGLPPTPICMPSAAAIEAALHPATGNALYFVARGDGTHQFSATLVEQNAAVRKYQLGHPKS